MEFKAIKNVNFEKRRFDLGTHITNYLNLSVGFSSSEVPYFDVFVYNIDNILEWIITKGHTINLTGTLNRHSVFFTCINSLKKCPYKISNFDTFVTTAHDFYREYLHLYEEEYLGKNVNDITIKNRAVRSASESLSKIIKNEPQTI